MKKSQRHQRPQTLLQWVFARENNLVTCELAHEGSRYCVRLFPSGGLRKAIVATFDAGLTAFQRHAAIASELRRGGWMLVAYR